MENLTPKNFFPLSDIMDLREPHTSHYPSNKKTANKHFNPLAKSCPKEVKEAYNYHETLKKTVRTENP